MRHWWKGSDCCSSGCSSSCGCGTGCGGPGYGPGYGPGAPPAMPPAPKEKPEGVPPPKPDDMGKPLPQGNKGITPPAGNPAFETAPAKPILNEKAPF